MVTNIVRRDDGVVEFPKDLMELVEHLSSTILADPKFVAYYRESDHDCYSAATLVLGLVISQLS